LAKINFLIAKIYTDDQTYKVVLVIGGQPLLPDNLKDVLHYNAIPKVILADRNLTKNCYCK